MVRHLAGAEDDGLRVGRERVPPHPPEPRGPRDRRAVPPPRPEGPAPRRGGGRGRRAERAAVRPLALAAGGDREGDLRAPPRGRRRGRPRHGLHRRRPERAERRLRRGAEAVRRAGPLGAVRRLPAAARRAREGLTRRRARGRVPRGARGGAGRDRLPRDRRPALRGEGRRAARAPRAAPDHPLLRLGSGQPARGRADERRPDVARALGPDAAAEARRRERADRLLLDEPRPRRDDAAAAPVRAALVARGLLLEPLAADRGDVLRQPDRGGARPRHRLRGRRAAEAEGQGSPGGAAADDRAVLAHQPRRLAVRVPHRQPRRRARRQGRRGRAEGEGGARRGDPGRQLRSAGDPVLRVRARGLRAGLVPLEHPRGRLPRAAGGAPPRRAALHLRRVAAARAGDAAGRVRLEAAPRRGARGRVARRRSAGCSPGGSSSRR